MALTQWEGQIAEYMSAQIDSYFLNSTGIISGSKNLQGGYGTYKTRAFGQDTSTWQAVTAGTDAIAVAGTTYQAVAPIIRRLHVRYFPEMEMLANNIDNGMLLQNEGIILGDNFAYNLQSHLFTNVLSGAFSSVGGSLSGTHLYDMSSSAFKWSYVQKQINKYGTPAQYKYAVVHSDVAGCGEVFDNIDAQPILNSSTPLRIFPDANYIGQIHGVHVFSTDHAALKSTNVYSTYMFGDNSVYVDYQEQPQVRLFEDNLNSGGAWFSKYAIAAGIGINGLTWGGATPSVLQGATDAAIALGTNWSKITNIANKNIGVMCVKTLVGA